MIATSQEVYSVLQQYNPWWHRQPILDLPTWSRASFQELYTWLARPPSHRAVLVSGARQVGKTTLLMQAAQQLIADGVPPASILYVTFDHPLLKLVGLERILGYWYEFQPMTTDIEYLLLDEIQYTNDWQTWVKHQVDFFKRRRIALTGSAMPLNQASQESGVGRWHVIKLPTLSFYEYLQIKEIEPPDLPRPRSLAQVLDWSAADHIKVSVAARPLVAHFHEYLLRGGFPQTARVESVSMAQKLLREDIVDKVLKRDMTALYGVRRVLELERTFLYLCLHDGGLLDVGAICSQLALNKQTVNSFIDLLEAAHLIYRLPRFGHGKEILRAKSKIYLADPAISGSVMLRGRALLEDGAKLGAAVETAVFKHIFARYYQTSIGFSYWQSKAGHEVDIVCEAEGMTIPFEVKYTRKPVGKSDLKGLLQFTREKNLPRGYVITQLLDDFGPIETGTATRLWRIPAVLACWWLSQSETVR